MNAIPAFTNLSEAHKALSDFATEQQAIGVWAAVEHLEKELRRMKGADIALPDEKDHNNRIRGMEIALMALKQYINENYPLFA